MAIRTPPRPSYIPVPTMLGSSPGVRASSALNGSYGMRASMDDGRTGRSSSLSVRTDSSMAFGMAARTEASRPVFSLLDGHAGGAARGHQRSYSTGGAAVEGGEASDSEADDGERILPVRVAVRLRPLGGGGEGAARGETRSCMSVVAPASVAVAGEDARAFHFDYVFGADAGQAAVYDAAVAPLLQRFVEGYNVTVLAYGQTSSGKTHTMGTDGDCDSGVVPTALRWLFAWAAQRQHADVRVSFLEVYNDELIDLAALAQGRGVRPPIFVREDARGRVVWTGVTEVAAASAAAALGVLADGSRERQTSATRMNDKSSRSHAIFSVALSQPRGDVRVVSKLHFVDLAGSERLKKTLAVGDRQREGIAINSGLLALGNVISALGDPHQRTPAFVPYRDSKLTHMLRDSLGGSALTLLVACVSPAEANMSESLNTLKYAARARNIRNRGGINVVATRAAATSREVESLRAVVRRLKAEVQVLTSKLQSIGQQQSTLAQPANYQPSRIPHPSAARRSPSALGSEASVSARSPSSTASEEDASSPSPSSNLLRSRNQALEIELEQLHETHADLLHKFNEACREIEERQSEGFARDQKLRDREQEIRRLTGHSRRQDRPSSTATAPISAAPEPSLPDLARLRSLRVDSIITDGPDAADFDAVLEEHDTKVRGLEDQLRAEREASASLRLELDMQEAKVAFAEHLESQMSNLRSQLVKAREAGLVEEERRRALEAELDDTVLSHETQLEAADAERRQELQSADEQWAERWQLAQAEHGEEIAKLRDAYAMETAKLLDAHAVEVARLNASHNSEVAQLQRALQPSLPKTLQLLSPPPTAHDVTAQDTAARDSSPNHAASHSEEVARARRLALDAEARADAAEAALAALTTKLSSPASSPSDEAVSRSSDCIVLCARNSMAHGESAAELRLRNMRHRYSTAAPTMADSPTASAAAAAAAAADRYASYPELRLTASSRAVSAAPVYDEDQIQRMLRDAAAEADSNSNNTAAASAAAAAAASELATLRGAKKELQERNSQMKNLMRDLGDRLVALAEENDHLEARANERDALAAEVDRLTLALADSEQRQRQFGDDGSPANADSDDSGDANLLRNQLQLVENELAGALQTIEEQRSHVGDLLQDIDLGRRRVADLEEDLAETMRQLDSARDETSRLEAARARAPPPDTDAELVRARTLVACLQESLAASEDNAEQAALASDRLTNELMRAHADIQAQARVHEQELGEISHMLDDARAMVSSEARDRDVWKSRCQDLREEVDELRVRRRQSKILCF